MNEESKYIRMKLHEVIDVPDIYLRVVRVFGGWIYITIDPNTKDETTSVFVPELPEPIRCF